jgi:hypothetical protein
MPDQLTLYVSEPIHVSAGVHQPVYVKATSGFYDDGRFQIERFDFGMLLLMGAAVDIHELSVDAIDILIVLTAGIDHKKHAAILLIMGFQFLGHIRIPLQNAAEVFALKNAAVLIIEYPETDAILQIEEGAEEFLCRDVYRIK